jgi:enterochelin esterase-like enzyme
MPTFFSPSSRVAIVAALALSACATSKTLQSDSPGQIDFVRLSASRSQKDCVEGTIMTEVCRVRRTFSAAELRRRLNAGTEVWVDANDLTFAYRGPGENVELSSGLQYPMSRVRDTDLWVVTLRIPDLPHATISYAMIPGGPGIAPAARIYPKDWRGRLAEPAALKATTLRGRIIKDTLASRYLLAPRPVQVYIPPGGAGAPATDVVYLGDGNAVDGLAPFLDTLISMGRLPRIMLVGMEYGRRHDSDPPDYDLRALEYLWTFDSTHVRFIAHEHFFLEEVIPWAERVHHAPTGRDHRATFGMSNSAAWAIDMGLRHPDVIGNVVSFSPGGTEGQVGPGARFAPGVRFYLQGGTLERSFLKSAVAWADTLRARGEEVSLRRVTAGHDWLVWSEGLPLALEWAWGAGHAKPSDNP